MQSVSYNSYCLKRDQLLRMEESLPTHFEVIVVGTGMEESILAAAASRNGHTVLHVDTNSFYGGHWAAFNFEGIQEWIKNQECEKPAREDKEFELGDGEKMLRLEEEKVFQDLKQEWFVSDEQPKSVIDATEELEKANLEESDDQKMTSNVEKKESDKEHENEEEMEKTVTEEKSNQAETEEAIPENDKPEDQAECPKDKDKPHRPEPEPWTKQRVLSNSRHFNLDLAPRLLYSRGSMVELLISSNISRYTEFKSVSRVLTLGSNGQLEHVPSSRADVFATKSVSVVEKRILMKFLTFCLNYETQMEKVEPFVERTFKDFLKHEKLTDNLIHFVLHSIAMVTDDTKSLEGLKATQKFLSSLGRFGNTPFLWSMYGSGELPQAFCRLAAVFGGTYYLGRSVDAIFTSGNQIKSIATDGKRINCDKLVLPGEICPNELKTLEHESLIGREIHLLSDSILPNEREQLTFLSIPPNPNDDNDSYTYVEEVGFGAAACPREMYCLHSMKDEKYDTGKLDNIIDPAKRVWRLSFNMKSNVYKTKDMDNLILCCGPRCELDYDLAIENARQSYEKMFPGEEFLPRAPEPEEIIIGGEENEENIEKETEEGDGQEAHEVKESKEEEKLEDGQ